MNNKAYLDSFSGLIPCIVLDVRDRDCVVKITKTMGGYRRGEIIEHRYLWIIPRKAVYTRSGNYRVRAYKWHMDATGAKYTINP